MIDWLCVSVHVCADAPVCMSDLHVAVRGKPRSHSSGTIDTFEAGSFTDLELTKYFRLSVQYSPRIHLSLPLQCWDYKHTPPGRTIFMWVLGISLKSSCLQSKHFPSWTVSPVPVIKTNKAATLILSLNYLGWPWICDLPPSSFRVPGIKGVCHQSQQKILT